MPVGKLNTNSSDRPGQTRTVFRPPWVKESESTPASSASVKTSTPWAKKSTLSTETDTTTQATPATTKSPQPTTTTTTKTPTTPATKIPAETTKKTATSSSTITPITTTTKTAAPAATKTPVTEKTITAPAATKTPVTEKTITAPGATKTPVTEKTITAPGATKTPVTEKTITAAGATKTPVTEKTTKNSIAATKTPVQEKTITTTATKTPVQEKTITTTNPTAPLSKGATPKVLTTKTNGATNPTKAPAPAAAPTVPAPKMDTTQKTVKLQSREIKVPIMTEKPKPIQPILKPVAKDPKTTKTPEQIEKELEEKFKIEKPKLRPVVMKTKSFAARKEKERLEAEAAATAAALAAKKALEEEDEEEETSEEEEETETDEESEDEDEEESEEDEKAKQLRFKLERPQLRHVVINKQKSFNKSVDEFEKIRPVLKKTPKIEDLKQNIEPEKPIFKDIELKPVPPKPAAPVPPPPPPPGLVPLPPPPPPLITAPNGFQPAPLTEKQKKTIEKLKSRPRKRPDWSDMMKEVEGGQKLRHVQCNDRSKPILTCKSLAKVDGQFVFETEKVNKSSEHNKMLKEIQHGIKLKPTKTNDRSKPILQGLRKFRRQMTIEEQIQKSESKAQLNQQIAAAEVVESEDEMDDIDKLRDDLQSTKQMLALELRNKEAQERENKRLLSKIANLEAELENEKLKIKIDPIYGDGSVNQDILNAITKSSTDENLVRTLKRDADDARKESKLLEKKYQESAEQLDQVRGASDEYKRKIADLEKKLSMALQGIPISLDNSRRQSTAVQKESSPELELEESESDENEDDEKKAERKIRRLGREVKLLQTKLTRLLDKENVAKKERANLKEATKKNQTLLKQETKKFKKLEKEVGKMAASMTADDDDDNENNENGEEDIEEEIEEESENEEESESDESEDESESETESESEPEDASDDDKKANLEPRVKRHEGRLAALKKGNFLLQTNVDRLLDEINITRTKIVSLQSELDAVIADLGF